MRISDWSADVCSAHRNAQQAGNRLIGILNDNDMSIAPPVGGLSAYLAKLVSSRPFVDLREIARRFARKLPEPLHKAARKTDEFARGMAMGGTLFEELGRSEENTSELQSLMRISYAG